MKLLIATALVLGLCQAHAQPTGGLVGRDIVSGVADQNPFVLGYLHGMLRGFQGGKSLSPHNSFCIPPGTTDGALYDQVVLASIRHLSAERSSLDSPIHSVIVFALVTSYPCRR